MSSHFLNKNSSTLISIIPMKIWLFKEIYNFSINYPIKIVVFFKKKGLSSTSSPILLRGASFQGLHFFLGYCFQESQEKNVELIPFFLVYWLKASRKYLFKKTKKTKFLQKCNFPWTIPIAFSLLIIYTGCTSYLPWALDTWCLKVLPEFECHRIGKEKTLEENLVLWWDCSPAKVPWDTSGRGSAEGEDGHRGVGPFLSAEVVSCNKCQAEVKSDSFTAAFCSYL